MSDSEDSTVTYTEVSSPFEDLSDIGSSRVDGLPMIPEDLYAYVEAALQAPLFGSRNKERRRDEISREIELERELREKCVYYHMQMTNTLTHTIHYRGRPLPAVDSPTADSRGYIHESDPEEDPEEDDEDLEEDPTDYPTDRDDDDKNEEEEEEEESFEDEGDDKEEARTMRRRRRRSTQLWLTLADVPEVTLPPQKRLCIALGLRYEVSESSSSPTTRPTGGFRADYGFVATLDDEIRRDPERDVGFRITNTWDEMHEGMPGASTIDETELGRRMTDFVTTVRQDTEEIYERLDDAQDDRVLMSGQLNMLRRDRRAHACTARLMETEENFLIRLGNECQLGYLIVNFNSIVYFTKMAPKRTTRSTPAITTTTTTTPVTNVQLKALIDKGIVDALQHVTLTEAEMAKTTMTLERIDLDEPEKEDDRQICPRGEIKKLEVELWNLKVKGTDVVSYNQCYQELALICARMFPEESDKIERYIGGLPDMIHGSVMASKPMTYDFGGVTDWYQEPRIMPPKMMKRKVVKKLVKKQIAEAIEEYEKTRDNPGNAGGSGPTNTGGTVNVQGCSHKTFMNGKPHPFNGVEGVVGLSRCIEKGFAAALAVLKPKRLKVDKAQ
nr:reverse transcriptase domain-containing protein [Tanacetum cinerariifolium]